MTALRTPNSASSYRFLQLFLTRRPAGVGVQAADGPDEDDFELDEDLDVEERPLARRR